MGRTPREPLAPLRAEITCFVLALAGAATLYAHAILIKSQPASNSKVSGPSFPVILTFNSRIDQSRSTLVLDGPGQTSSVLTVKRDDASPEKLLSAVANAKTGAYRIRWQVLSVDGHITRGQIPFQVQ
jgi:methionine-rich copper-binding protein CopC